MSALFYTKVLCSPQFFNVRALVGFEKGLVPEHTSTLETVRNLGNLYRHQGKLREAEDMYVRAFGGI